MNTKQPGEKAILFLIVFLSISIPVIISFILLAGEKPVGMKEGWWQFLPALNAGINSSVTVLLLAGKILIRRGKRKIHKTIMISAAGLSAVFLVSYLIYHSFAGDIKYGGSGIDKVIYLFILFTHILLSVGVVPLVLFALARGLAGEFARHKNIVKWAWPAWLYVSVTGVLVYLFAHVFNPAGQ